MKKNSNFEPLFKIIRYLTQPVFVLLWTVITVYAVFVPLLGFYWDDLAIQWISQVYGTAGLARYFSTNRPVWGLFYQLNTTLLGKEPWIWHCFGLFWRWAAAVGLYFLLKQFWQKQKEPALVGALFFIVYPAFGGQFISTVFGHFFIVLCAYFFSVYFSLKALESPQRRNLHIILAVLLSAVNVFSMEYFFMLELLRPIFFLLYLLKENKPWKTLLKPVVLNWLPYLFVFLSAGIWRSFIFNYQTENYTPKLLTLLKTQPLAGLGALFSNIGRDYWLTLIAAWGKIFQIPDLNSFGKTATLLYAGGAVLVVILLGVVFYFNQTAEEKETRKTARIAILLGLIAILPAGVPFWLTDLPLKLSFPNDRFSIPYLLGCCLFLSGFLYSLPLKRWLRLSLVIFLVAGGGAVQIRNGIAFERDWEQQSRFFWQLTWRMPSLEPGTILYAQEMPLQYFSDNSLTSTLNWMYDPEPQDDTIPYILFYPSVRIGDTFEALDANMKIKHDLLIGDFYGNSSQSVAIYYNPPSCLRVLEADIEADNWMVPNQVRQVLNLSNPDYILLEEKANLPAYLYAPQPEENWCYYFEKADLARQYGDWEEVVRLGELGFALDDNPNDPAERLPFIEGYAHTGNWEQALSLTQETADITPVMHPVLCSLWQRIAEETETTSAQIGALQSVFNQLECKN